MNYIFSKIIFSPPSCKEHDEKDIFYLSLSPKIKIPYYFVNKNSNNILICSFGNSQDLCSSKYLISKLASELNISCIGYDYPGYGLSSNSISPSEKLNKEAAKAIYMFVTTGLNYNNTNIITFGYSLGTFSALYLAKIFFIKSCILVSPFSTISEVGLGCNLPFLSMFDNTKNIQDVICPTLIIIGKKDTLVTPYISEKLFNSIQNAHKAICYIDNSNHNNILLQSLSLIILDFFEDQNIELN